MLASHLQTAIAKYGEPRLTPVSLQLIEQVAGAWAAAAPAADHPVGRWFRPLVADRFADEGIATLGELVALCNARGGSWWRTVPRIGAGRARVLVAWLRRHTDALGVAIAVVVDLTEPLATPGPAIEPARGQLVPLERLAIPHPLYGAQGANRAPGFAYIAAPHDLAAVRESRQTLKNGRWIRRRTSSLRRSSRGTTISCTRCRWRCSPRRSSGLSGCATADPTISPDDLDYQQDTSS